ncbi:MAG: YCF48-related protein [Planctomycetota bacterium]
MLVLPVIALLCHAGFLDLIRPVPAAPIAKSARPWRATAAMPGAAPVIYQLADTPADGNRIYAASSAGVLLSRDRGLSFTLRAHSPVAWNWEQIAVSPLDADVVIACSWGSGLFRTEDGGATWTRPAGALRELALWSPVFCASDASRVYVIADDGVWRSLDGGHAFTPVLAGFLAQGGLGWQVLADAADAMHVYAIAADIGLFESVDGGEHWQRKDFPPGERFPNVAIDVTNGDRLLLGDRDLHLSTDGGDSWQRVFDATAIIDAVAIDPLHANRLHAGLRSVGLFSSDDGGATWTLVRDRGLDRSSGDPLTILSSRLDANLLMIGDHGGVFRSLDRGATFARSNGGLANLANVTALAVDRLDRSHLVARTGGSAFTSHDGGSTWVESITPRNFLGYGLAQDAVDAQRFHAPSWNGPFGRSEDGGATFAVTPGAGAPGYFVKVVAHPVIAGRLFVTGGGVYRSDDAGDSFVRLDVPASWTWAIAISPVQPDIMYCDAAYRSVDGGATWIAVNNPPPGIVRDVVADPIVADRAYAATQYAGVWRTEDRGATWTMVSPSLMDADALAVQGQALVANDSARADAFLSFDTGESVLGIGRGLCTSITSMVALSDAPDCYAGTSGSGVMRR